MKATLVSTTLGVIGGILLVLCAGALWSVVALLTGGVALWMALPVAGVAVVATDWCGLAHPAMRAALTLALLAMATVYACILYSGTVIAMSMGMRFGDALVMMGPELALIMGRLRLEHGAWWWLVLAATVAVVVSARRGHRGVTRA